MGGSGAEQVHIRGFDAYLARCELRIGNVLWQRLMTCRRHARPQVQTSPHIEKRPMCLHSLQLVPAPSMDAGDFNGQHKDGGHSQTPLNVETQSQQGFSGNALLLFDPKEPPNIFSARWHSHTNTDLTFCLVSQ